ncbi:MAG: YggS family pyridoxal phosphate-dependent enzyme [Calditrichaeota bacterium]|nr:YggS family pyridoxal phosphate-dependent enzyme [Calditrichota bacterium]
MSSIYQKLLEEIPESCRIVAVSKRQANDAVQQLYNEGQRLFGENQVQEFLSKKGKLPPDIEWHFIGTLQKNKVNKIVGEVRLIHSVDNFPLAEKINNRAENLGIQQDVLIQVNISGEISKSGFSIDELKRCFADLLDLSNLKINGLMTIGDHVDDAQQIGQTFRKCKQILEDLNNQYKLSLNELSMGMSGDYKLAIEEGATLVRIGSLLFGQRN